MSLLVAEAKLWLQIAPAYLGDVDLGIREQLNASLLQHVSALNGAVLAYDSLKLLDGLGCIRNDLPHLHLPVSLRILVFSPRVGDVLLGVVRRQGTDHTALLVHGMFSAAVASTKQRAEGKLLRFVVRSLQVTDGMLSLVGDPSSSASRAGAAEHVLAGPSGSSSPLRVSASRAVDAPEAVSFLRGFLDEGGKSVHADVLAHMQTVREALEENTAARGGSGSRPGGGAEGAPQEGEPPSEKKKKKKKDKDEPKRALSAYMYFMQKNRELIKSDYLAKHGEEIKFTEIAKDAGARWGRRLRGVSWRCHSPLPRPPGAGSPGSWLRAGDAAQARWRGCSAALRPSQSRRFRGVPLPGGRRCPRTTRRSTMKWQRPTSSDTLTT